MTTHLPIATQFCAAEIDIAPGVRFFVDGNSKITCSNGTYAAPAPNAFSLPARSVSGVGHCPAATEACRSSCYVRGLAQHAPDLYAKYHSNYAALDRCMHNVYGLWRASVVALGAWIREHARGGFRWHVSGDVLHSTHAYWIADVCTRAPDVAFWIYTRTLDIVPILARVPNLAVNVSADRENYTEARRVALNEGVRLCYLVNGEDTQHAWDSVSDARPPVCTVCGAGWNDTGLCTGVPDDLPDGSVIFPDYALRGRALGVPTSAPWWQRLSQRRRAMVCPTDFFGQSEAHRCGPCMKCF